MTRPRVLVAGVGNILFGDVENVGNLVCPSSYDPALRATRFEIRPSDEAAGTTATILPDIATCPAAAVAPKKKARDFSPGPFVASVVSGYGTIVEVRSTDSRSPSISSAA